MRTTVSLDDDIVHSLKQEMQRSGISFKEAVNYYLRLGLRKKFCGETTAARAELRLHRKIAGGSRRPPAPMT
jgi:hypothetical protein